MDIDTDTDTDIDILIYRCIDIGRWMDRLCTSGVNPEPPSCIAAGTRRCNGISG